MLIQNSTRYCLLLFLSLCITSHQSLFGDAPVEEVPPEEMRALQHSAGHWPQGHEPNQPEAAHSTDQRLETFSLSDTIDLDDPHAAAEALEKAQLQLERENQKVERLQEAISQLEAKQNQIEITPEVPLEFARDKTDLTRPLVHIPAAAISGFLPNISDHTKYKFLSIIPALIMSGLIHINAFNFNGSEVKIVPVKNPKVVPRHRGTIIGGIVTYLLCILLDELIVGSENSALREFFQGDAIKKLQTTAVEQIIEESRTENDQNEQVYKRVKILPEPVYNALMVAAEKYKSGEWRIGQLRKYVLDFKQSALGA